MCKRILVLCSTLLALAAGSALAGAPVKGPFAGTVHALGTITYKDGSQKSWTWDRGRITGLDASSITLTRRDKAQVTVAITASTLVRNDGSSYQLSDLKLGLAATVLSQSGNALIIRHLRGEGAPSGADQSAIEGPGAHSVTGTIDAQYVDGSTKSFDYNRGRIKQVGDGELTIKRQDGNTVSFSYDETTLVREKGEVKSVDDLEVGEGAMFFSQNGSLVLVRCLGHGKQAPALAGGKQTGALARGKHTPATPAAA